MVVCYLYALSICYYDGLFDLCVDCWLLVDVCIRGFVCFPLWGEVAVMLLDCCVCCFLVVCCGCFGVWLHFGCFEFWVGWVV